MPAAMAHPVCSRLGRMAKQEMDALDTDISLISHGRPQSTMANPCFIRTQCDVIGMTTCQKQKYEEICYASIAMVTDFDCWHPDQ